MRKLHKVEFRQCKPSVHHSATFAWLMSLLHVATLGSRRRWSCLQLTEQAERTTRLHLQVVQSSFTPHSLHILLEDPQVEIKHLLWSPRKQALKRKRFVDGIQAKSFVG